MSEWLHKSNVIVLNSLFQIIGTISPQKAMIALCGYNQHNSTPPAKAIDVEYGLDSNGNYDFNNVISFKPCELDEWLKVPIRNSIDRIIHTSNREVRCPTVIVVVNYSKMPMRKARLSKDLLFKLQDGKCWYSNRALPFNKMNKEHIHAKSHGGKDEWSNIILVDKEINFKRGNKSLEEMGLKPLGRHKQPLPTPITFTIKVGEHPDHRLFLTK